MAYFAVAKDRDNKAFSVHTCHLNFWVLPGLFRPYYQFDVGLRLIAEEDKLTSFHLALPFTVRSSGVEDLYDLLVQQDTAPMVFGEPVTIQGNTLSYTGAQALQVGRINAGRSREVTEWTSKKQHCSVWRIDLGTEMNKGDERYFRFRFPIDGLGRRWLSKRSLFAVNGAIMDIRVADVREAQEAMDWRSLQDKILPIPLLNAFIITPMSLQARSVSPALKYTRLLEGTAWEPYLRRKTGMLRSRQLLIFYWKAEHVSIEKPFRGFLDLSTEFGVSSFANHFLTGVVAVLAFIAALYVRDGYAAMDWAAVSSALAPALRPANGYWALGVLVGGWLLKMWGPVQKVFAWLRRLPSVVDQGLYRKA